MPVPHTHPHTAHTHHGRTLAALHTPFVFVDWFGGRYAPLRLPHSAAHTLLLPLLPPSRLLTVAALDQTIGWTLCGFNVVVALVRFSPATLRFLRAGIRRPLPTRHHLRARQRNAYRACTHCAARRAARTRRRAPLRANHSVLSSTAHNALQRRQPRRIAALYRAITRYYYLSPTPLYTLSRIFRLRFHSYTTFFFCQRA